MKNKINTENIEAKIDLIFNTFEELKKLASIAKSELSNIDKELSNHYHNIEGTVISNVFESHFFIMKLKNILKERRDAKIHQTMVESFVASLKTQMAKAKVRNEEITIKHQKILDEIIRRAK